MGRSPRHLGNESMEDCLTTSSSLDPYRYQGILTNLWFMIVVSTFVFLLWTVIWIRPTFRRTTWNVLVDHFKTLLYFPKRKVKSMTNASGYEYLRFSRQLILCHFIMCLIGLSTVLPIHLAGGRHPVIAFHATNIGNVDPKSQLTWVNVTLAMLMLPASFVAMKRFLAGMEVTEVKSKSKLIVSGIPVLFRYPNMLALLLREYYPGCGINPQDVVFNKKVKISNDLRHEEKVLTHTLEMFQKQSWKENFQSYYFDTKGIIFGWFKETVLRRCSRRNPVQYYKERQEKLAEEMRELEAKDDVTLDSAVVEVANLNYAEQIVFFHKFRSFEQPKFRLLPRVKIDYAPLDSDVFRSSNQLSTPWMAFWRFLSNVFTLVLIVFLTNAQDAIDAIIMLIDMKAYKNEVRDFFDNHGQLRTTWVLLVTWIWIFISMNVWRRGYWTESSFHRGVFGRYFWYLVVSLLFVPLLDLTVIGAITKATEYLINWECVYLEDSGTYFINNMLTMAFLGNTFELLRGKNLAFMGWHLLKSKSVPELEKRYEIFKEEHNRFLYGEYLSVILLNHVIVVVLFPTSPLILPFGLLFLVLKYLTDGTNILTKVYDVKEVDTSKMFGRTIFRVLLLFTVFSQILTSMYILMRDKDNLSGPVINYAANIPPYFIIFNFFLVLTYIRRI